MRERLGRRQGQVRFRGAEGNHYPAGISRLAFPGSPTVVIKWWWGSHPRLIRREPGLLLATLTLGLAGATAAQAAKHSMEVATAGAASHFIPPAAGTGGA